MGTAAPIYGAFAFFTPIIGEVSLLYIRKYTAKSIAMTQLR